MNTTVTDGSRLGSYFRNTIRPIGFTGGPRLAGMRCFPGMPHSLKPHYDRDLRLANERVAFMHWALATHRAMKVRSPQWSQLEADYSRRLEEAKRELERLKNATA